MGIVYVENDPRPLFLFVDFLHEPATEPELARVRQSVERGQPFGSEDWVERTAKTLGLEATLRSPGRPRKLVVDERPDESSVLLGG